MNRFFILTFFLLVTSLAYSQEKPMRIGLKFGVPNIAGLHAEYLTPALNGRLAPSVDFSSFSISLGDTETKFNYLEFGGNYYFKDTGRGLYGNLSYGRIGFKGSYSDPVLGEGEGKLGINLLNFKLGARLGKAFYFRPEIGYALLLGGNSVSVEYVDPTTGNRTVEEEDIPGLLGGGVVINIGFGFAF